ncbi:hypothetical protein ACFL0W_04125 [Nanoarchaeota archaeon]
MAEKKLNDSFTLLSIVAIFAIVGIIIMVLGSSNCRQAVGLESDDMLIDEDTDLTGMAYDTSACEGATESCVFLTSYSTERYTNTTDIDGVDYYTRSSILFYDNYYKRMDHKSDRCHRMSNGNVVLIEYIAGDDGRRGSEFVMCGSNFVCDKGACMERCDDSDLGKSYDELGVASMGEDIRTDYCRVSYGDSTQVDSSPYLIEMYCDAKGYLKTEFVNCAAKGYGDCMAGVCQTACSDSDAGKNYGMIGTASLGADVRTDWCRASMADTTHYKTARYMIEMYCDSAGDLKTEFVDCIAEGYEGCQDGKCVGSNPVCNDDGDRGKVYSKKATTIYGNSWKTDYCRVSMADTTKVDSSQYLVEMYCNNAGELKTEFVDCVEQGFFGCVDGMCADDKYGCSDGDCFSCIDSQALSDLNLLPLSDQNDITEDRINLVFVTADLPEDSIDLKNLFLEYIDFDKPENIGDELFDEGGVLTLEPFRSNEDKFNWWYIEKSVPVNYVVDENKKEQTILLEYNTKRGVVMETKYEAIANIVPNTVIVFLVFTDIPGVGSSYAMRGKRVVMGINTKHYPIHSINRALNELSLGFNEQTFIHEFSHAVGFLKDEYRYGSGDESFIPDDQEDFPPNCVRLEKAKELWGDLVGQGEGVLEVGFFPGCMAFSDTYRPTKLSLMQDEINNEVISAHPELRTPERLGPANIRFVQQRLDEYTGLNKYCVSP